MGSLSKFELNEYINKYNSEFFIETGTYKGDGLSYAKMFNFSKLFSIEILKELQDSNILKFKNDDRITLINNNSIDGLSDIFTKNKIGSTIFWLDAHLPKFYSNEYDDDYIKNKDILIPLELELEIIKNSKNIESDVFIIDDLRIYERGNFVNGEWLDVIKSGFEGISFIDRILSDTHTISKLYTDEGYILCIPKNK
jgi:hypothetical protein